MSTTGVGRTEGQGGQGGSPKIMLQTTIKIARVVTREEVEEAAEILQEALRPTLRLSPLLRYALASARPRHDRRPNLLPSFIPERCCHNLFGCGLKVEWRVGDGRNQAYFCQIHYDQFMEARDVFDYVSERFRL